MSNRDIDRAYTLLRRAAGGQEPYAASVAPIARALSAHDTELVNAVLKPFIELADIARSGGLLYVTTPLKYFDVAIARGKSLGGQDPELCKEVAADTAGVAPVDK